jgi:N-methylhydantoinase A
MSWRIGADVGGTFTDIIAVGDDGDLLRIKVPSTREDYAGGIRAGLADRVPPAARRNVAQFVHGTTVATNAILEETEVTLGLVTTAGFRDLLEIRRSRRPTLYDLAWRPPPPLIGRRLRLEVNERIGADGEIVTPLHEADVLRAADVLAAAGVDAVAVCLLNSHHNPVHELRVAELLSDALAPIPVTASCTIAPEPGEFERSSTTAVNALLLPVVRAYMTRLEDSLHELEIGAPLQIMQSDAATAAASVLRERPFLMIESGPAAGVSAAARLAEEMGRAAVVTFDMGGTTAKASLVESSRVELTEELEVGDSLNQGGGFMRGAGYIVRSPCVDLTEVGSGGGSLAWIDAGGALRVGPRSAGSTPGPACYGNGGTEPTVSDAHVVLGYLNPEAIAGGTKRIHPELADAAIGRLAEPLGLSVLDAAYGIYTIATAAMRRAVRAVSVERGRDVRDHALIAFGGAGGLHAAALAREMEMTEVIVPIVAGLFSSLGLLFADTAVARVDAHRAVLTEEGLAGVDASATTLAADARAELLARHGEDAKGSLGTEILLSLRYVGQSSTLTLPHTGGGPEEPARLQGAFHQAHRQAYGHAAIGEPIEVTAIRARAFRRAAPLRFADIAARTLGHIDGERRRELYFGAQDGMLEAPVIGRGDLATGALAGPLVIEEAETTVVVPPGLIATLHPTGSIVMGTAP